MTAVPTTFGGGLGAAIGGALGAQDLQAGLDSVGQEQGGFTNTVAPYNSFGQSFLPKATDAIDEATAKSNTTLGYDDFMKNYTNTPAVQYQLGQADNTINNSAASKEQLLSGANLRALNTQKTGIVQQGANTAYNEYLAGNNQQFGQLETALGNMFSAIGVGTTATGQRAGVTNAEIGGTSSIAGAGISGTSSIAGANITGTSNIAGAQAKNDQQKGSGIGSMFSGLGSLAAAF